MATAEKAMVQAETLQKTSSLDPEAQQDVSRRSTVDIVIPCYNYARYLRSAVQSALSQQGVNVRVLVIDDASTDESPEVGRELAAANPSVEFRRHVANKGHIATYNEGLIGWASADYTVLLSADDLLAPGCLARAVQVMENDRTIGMVYGRAVHFAQQHELPTVDAKTFTFLKYTGADWVKGRCRSGYNVITSPEVVVRGSVQRAIGGYRPELPHTGDLEMWLRVAAVSDIAYIKAVPQAFYRVHQASMQRTKYRSSLVDFVHRRAAFDHFLEHLHAGPERLAQLNHLVRRALAREALWDVCRAYDHDQVEGDTQKDLLAFALEVYPGATQLSEYAALGRRQRLGATLCHRTQIFLAPASIRWAKRWLRKRRWERRGV